MNFYRFRYFRGVKKENIKYFSVMALILIVLLKVSSFHVFAHQDSSIDTIENCTICDLAIENQNVEFTATVQSAKAPRAFVIVSKVVSKAPPSESSPNHLHFKLFGRPPPGLV